MQMQRHEPAHYGKGLIDQLLSTLAAPRIFWLSYGAWSRFSVAWCLVQNSGRFDSKTGVSIALHHVMPGPLIHTNRVMNHPKCMRGADEVQESRKGAIFKALTKVRPYSTIVKSLPRCCVLHNQNPWRPEMNFKLSFPASRSSIYDVSLAAPHFRTHWEQKIIELRG